MSDILKKINDALMELGDDCEWVKAPEFVAEYEPLRGKRLILVDDVLGVIINFLAELMIATDGNFIPVHHKGESVNVLVEKTLVQNADIILMDYTLAKGVSGDIVTSKLREAGFKGVIIGFSSEADKAEKFSKAGADASIKKNNAQVSEVVLSIANFIKSRS